MKTCKNGHKENEIRRLKEYDASGELGAPFPVILVDSVDERFCAVCGERISVSFQNWTDLIAVVAVKRATDSHKLNGKEVRFLRRSLGRKAKDFAHDVAMSAEQLSRYENDKQPISEVYERLVRAHTCLGHFDQAYRLGVDMKGLLAMKISSVRPCDQSVSVELCLSEAGEETPKFTPMTQSDEQTWKMRA